jgi:hypothetical protein
MKYFAGLDVSLDEAAICIVDEDGIIVTEGKAASEPDELVRWLAATGLTITRIGLEQHRCSFRRESAFAVAAGTGFAKRPKKMNRVPAQRRCGSALQQTWRVSYSRCTWLIGVTEDVAVPAREWLPV